jgi:hypothetical protein
MDIPSHIDRMAETPRRHLEVTVVARDDSWEWQVQSEDTVLISGTGRTRLLARFLGNDARLRLLAEDFGDLIHALKEFRGPREKPLRLSDVKQMFLEMRVVIG